jgi:propanol-preferring alcohol dehydrogenase
MKAWLLARPGPLESSPLQLKDVPDPVPGPGEIHVRVEAAGIEPTDLAAVEGVLPVTRFPLVPGHAAAGVVESVGGSEQGGDAAPASRFRPGDRVVAFRWRSSCGSCVLCRGDGPHLCATRRENGVNADGAFAERLSVPEGALVALPETLTFAEAAALAGDGVMGYRAAAGAGLEAGHRVGILGYGSAGVVAQLVAGRAGASVFVFTRSEPHRQLARTLGAQWAGAIEDHPATAEPLDFVLSLGIAGRVLPAALRHLRPGGSLVFAVAAFFETIPALDYIRHLDRERSISSVSSAPRRDLVALLDLAAGDASFRVATEVYPFEAVPEALDAVKANRVRGAAITAPRP